MIELFHEIKDLVLGRSKEQLAQIAAYILSPLLVLMVAFAGLYSPSLGLGFAQPLAVTRLLTEIDETGTMSTREGLALLLEPTETEFHLNIQTRGNLWTSLDQATFQANSDRLKITDFGLSGKTPLNGVGDPALIIISGVAADEVLVPGGKVSISEWEISSRRSYSALASALLICIFAFGMAVALGFPIGKAVEH